MTWSATCNRVSATVAIMSFLIGCFLEVSCQTVITYTTKDAESLPCAITDQTATVTWAETTVGNPNTVLTYQKWNHTVINKIMEKYKNFNYTLEPTSLNLVIENVEDGDGGVYTCTTSGVNTLTFDVTVEVLAKPTVQYESQDVDVLNVIVGTSYDLTCSATGARSQSDLSLVWDPSLVEKTPLIITSNGDYMDYSITSTYTAVRGDSSITCQLSGYAMQDEINDQRMGNISHTVNLNVQNAPVCNLVISEGDDCTEVTLICECDAVPDITRYFLFNGSSLINDGTIETFTKSVAYGTSTEFSCSATNYIGPGDKSDVKVHVCEATESTTEKSVSTTTKEPEALTLGAKVGTIFGALAVVFVIVVIAVIMWKKGEGDSKSESDKPDDNGAGPGKDPEIPAYGVIDKKKVKDLTPAPHSSMRDSTNSSKPKQDVEMQYADLHHGNKPQSNEVRKPKEEPTEYATVQSVIV